VDVRRKGSGLLYCDARSVGLNDKACAREQQPLIFLKAAPGDRASSSPLPSRPDSSAVTPAPMPIPARASAGAYARSGPREGVTSAIIIGMVQGSAGQRRHQNYGGFANASPMQDFVLIRCL